jgi:hypothetical protein
MDPWAVLGLLPTCEPEVLEAAVRALRLKYHPDKAGSGGADAFRKIEEAARCCRMGEQLVPEAPDARALRDRLRAIWRTG